MSYDIHLKDPVTGDTAEVPGHLMTSGTYKANYHPKQGRLHTTRNTEFLDTICLKVIRFNL